MSKQDPVISQLTQWADNNANIRALILRSSRAAKNRDLDFLSDYDVEVFARDTAPFSEDDTWLLGFGEIMVRWPARPQVTGDEDWVTQLVLFKNRVRIDFKITSKGPDASPNLSSAYEVLADKDGLSSNIPAPSLPYETIQQPSSADFESRVLAFWWDSVYVAKGLYSSELNYSKAMLDGTIRFEKLLPLLNWYIGLARGWNINTGLHGKWLDEHLDTDIWRLYQETFVEASNDGLPALPGLLTGGSNPAREHGSTKTPLHWIDQGAWADQLPSSGGWSDCWHTSVVCLHPTTR